MNPIITVNINASFDVDLIKTRGGGEMATCKTNDEIIAEFKKFCEKNGWYLATPEEESIVVEHNGGIDGDDTDMFEHPVGWLAPDGVFYVIDSSVTAFGHIALARRVWDLYRSDFTDVIGESCERKLEQAGFIKVHDAQLHFFGGYHKNGKMYGDIPTVAQINALCRYAKYHSDYGELTINDLRSFTPAQLRQMDIIQLKKNFSL